MSKLIQLPLISLLFLFSIATFAMENTITYHQATPQHKNEILNLMNNHAIDDNNKIVILPKMFRESSITTNISAKRLFCATTNTGAVVAFKKLYIIDTQDEYNTIVNDEIRCTGTSRPVKTQTFKQDNKAEILQFHAQFPISFHNSIAIYFGGDYTKPSHRNQGINTQLIKHAFNTITGPTTDLIQTKNPLYIVVFYGLTKFNAGENNGIDRTPSIVREFRIFLKNVLQNISHRNVDIHKNIINEQYTAYMPTFDPNSIKCEPLPDDKSILGFGHILIFPLNNTNTTQ